MGAQEGTTRAEGHPSSLFTAGQEAEPIANTSPNAAAHQPALPLRSHPATGGLSSPWSIFRQALRLFISLLSGWILRHGFPLVPRARSARSTLPLPHGTRWASAASLTKGTSALLSPWAGSCCAKVSWLVLPPETTGAGPGNSSVQAPSPYPNPGCVNSPLKAAALQTGASSWNWSRRKRLPEQDRGVP